MMELRTFKSQTFNLEGQQFLYQIHLNNQNSQIAIYNNQGKMCSIQHVRLPAKCNAYACQNYLVLLNESQILLYKIPNLGINKSCPNPGIKQIITICYNRAANLLFLVDNKNRLYYLLPQINSVRIKMIFGQDINAKISKVAVDNESIVHLLCDETKTMHTLTFDWNKNDKLISHQIEQNIADIYCRFKWKAVIRYRQNDEQHYSLYINQDIQKDSEFQINVPKFSENKLPIMKGALNDFVYVDGYSKTIILIKNGQLISSSNLDIRFPLKGKSNNFLFEIKNKSYNTILLKLHYFQGMREPFYNIDVPLNSNSEMEEQQSIHLYIHNNIHLILTQTGLSPHFSDKVREYINNNDEDIGDERIICQFLEKLLKINSLTAVKLGNNLVSQQKRYLAQELRRYVSYIYTIVDKVSLELGQQVNNLQKISQDLLQVQYSDRRNYIQNIITFICILYSGIKHQEQRNPQKNINYMNMQKEQSQCQSYGYYRCVHKCKTLYLLNELTYVRVKKNLIQQNQQINAQNEKITQFIKNNEMKIGFNTCHQFFNEQLPHILNFHQIFTLLQDCSNFYFAAYLYISYVNTDVIPYIGDPQTVQFIKFLVKTTHQGMIKDKAKNVFKNLPRMTSKALMIGQPAFQKFLCCLSINSQEYKCCLAIILSGTTKKWSIKQQRFIITCLILCNRTLLAYRQLCNQQMNGQSKDVLLEQFVTKCIKYKKIRDLMQINYDEKETQYIHQRLRNQIGEDIDNIRDLMNDIQKTNRMNYELGR